MPAIIIVTITITIITIVTGISLLPRSEQGDNDTTIIITTPFLRDNHRPQTSSVM